VARATWKTLRKKQKETKKETKKDQAAKNTVAIETNTVGGEDLEQGNELMIKGTVVERPVDSRSHLPSVNIDFSEEGFDHEHRPIIQAIDMCCGTKGRILFGFFQVYFAYYKSFHSSSLKSVPFNVFAWTAVVDFDVTALLNLFRVRCAWDYDRYDTLLLYTVLPAAFAVIMIIVFFCIRVIVRKYKQAILVAKTQSITMILFVGFLIYPGVSRVIFSTFICDTYPTADNENVPKLVLREDPRVNCESSGRTGWIIYTWAMVVVYPIGVASLYCLLLVSIRAARYIRKKERSAEQLYQLARVKFLIKPYRLQTYWFEAYELVRKLCQTTAPMFLIYATNSTQVGIFFAQAVTLFAICFLQTYKPYTLRTDFYLAMLSQVIILVVCIVLQLEHIAKGDVELADMRDFKFSTVVIAVFTVEIAAFLGLCGYDLRLFYKNKEELKRSSVIRKHKLKHAPDTSMMFGSTSASFCAREE